MKNNLLVLVLISSLIYACGDDDVTTPANPVVLQNHSKTPHMLELKSEFSDVDIYTLLSSEDTLSSSPDFVYGSMADGAGLLKNDDGTFTLINNIEGDYAIARITLDRTFRPTKGEYIVNSEATANTAQCSGSLITPKEHGFGPLYLSGGEWGGSATNVFVTDPFKDASAAGSAKTLVNFGQWTTENAVVLGKDAFPGKTVALIGDDSHGEAGGQLAMYVSNTVGDLDNGKLYGLKVGDGNIVDNDLVVDQEYDVTFVELNERTYDALNDEAMAKKVMAFNRVEDIDYRKGSGEANREFYFNATGRHQFTDTRTLYGRVYKVVLDENDPTKGKLTLVLDGDDLNGKAKNFHSPDNILVTENYAYIQEDPNGYDDDATKQHDAYVYQYNLNTGELKIVLEVDRDAYIAGGYGSADDAFGTWELTGMIDISDEIGTEGSFLLIVQAHSWYDDAFLNPDGAGTDENSSNEGSYALVLKGLER